MIRLHFVESDTTTTGSVGETLHQTLKETACAHNTGCRLYENVVPRKTLITGVAAIFL